jgi:Lhr-like helicase
LQSCCICLLYCLQYEREAALRDFSSGTVSVLIATDVASRGLDVKGIGHVINMDLPRAFEDYVHRIGEDRHRLYKPYLSCCVTTGISKADMCLALSLSTCARLAEVVCQLS